jgi:hypothetical protein
MKDLFECKQCGQVYIQDFEWIDGICEHCRVDNLDEIYEQIFELSCNFMNDITEED